MPKEARRNWANIRSEKVPPEQEAAVEAGVRALRDAISLRDLRAEQGVTQVELAGRLGKTQGSVSELERRDDVYLSSLREYVVALGGRLEIAAVFEDRTRLIDLMDALEASVNAARAIDRSRASRAQRPAAAKRAAKSA